MTAEPRAPSGPLPASSWVRADLVRESVGPSSGVCLGHKTQILAGLFEQRVGIVYTVFRRFHRVGVCRRSQTQEDRQQMPEQMQGSCRGRKARPWEPPTDCPSALAGVTETGDLMRKMARPLPKYGAQDGGGAEDSEGEGPKTPCGNPGEATEGWS